MIRTIHPDDLPLEALAAIDGSVDQLEFGLDEGKGSVYCLNQDERAAWIWDAELAEWIDFPYSLYMAVRADA